MSFITQTEFARSLFGHIPCRQRSEDFELRSLLRTREAHFRKSPLADAHVRAYLSLSPTDRSLWCCPSCNKVMRHMLRPRGEGGHLLKHCGCRLGMHGKRRAPMGSRSPEYKRQQRYRSAMASGKAPIAGAFVLHDAHAKARRLWLARPAKPSLHDAHVKAWKALSHRWRTANDAAYRMNQRLRVQVRKAMRGMKRGRAWESLLGYSLDDLMAHLERMLPRGWSLKKAIAAGWHLDHITPKVAFDCASDSGVRAAWCLSNLRLIPARENLRKNAKMEFLL